MMNRLIGGRVRRFGRLVLWGEQGARVGGLTLPLLLGLVTLCGCSKESEQPKKEPGVAQTQPVEPAAGSQVVLYTSTDEPLARQVIDAFTRRTGIGVEPLFDTEADKTTGLARRIRSEAASPRADVFWASEPFQMIQLAEEDLLARYMPDTARSIPIAYRDAKDRWVGFALRARVLAYDPGVLPPDQQPKTWEELAQPAFASKVVFANPLFGTTRGHMAAMLTAWGEPAFTSWLERLAAGGVANRLAAGNAQVAKSVAMGQAVMGATDTDDVYAQQRSGAKVEMLYLDMGGGGTLLLPNTVAVIKDAPHAPFAKQLAAFLCSQQVEQMLAESDSRNVPVRPGLRARLHIELPSNTPVDYVKVAEAMPKAIEIVQEIWK
jgi:iron(III) transport system substrate-binding protein